MQGGQHVLAVKKGLPGVNQKLVSLMVNAVDSLDVQIKVGHINLKTCQNGKFQGIIANIIPRGR